MSYLINFSGMVGFVPEVSKDDQAKKRMRVLLVDGRTPHRSTVGEVLTPHYAFIHFKLADLADDSPRRPDLTGNGQGICLLNNEELEFQPEEREASLDFSLTDDVAEIAGSGYAVPPLKDLGWIMPIDAIIGKDEDPDLQVDPRCLATVYEANVPGKNLLISRAQLRTGRLYTRDLRRTTMGGERVNTVCSFSPNSGGGYEYCQQPIATLVTFEPGIQEPLVVHSTRFKLPKAEEQNRDQPGSEAELPQLRFKSPSDVGGKIEINIWNAILSDVLDLLAGPKDKHQWYLPEGNRSFHAFFRLCRNPPNKGLPVFSHDEFVASALQAPYVIAKNVGCPTGRYAVEELK